MNGFIGEFLGTMILIVLGVGTGAGINLKTSYARNAGWLFVTLAWGMAVAFGVYVAGSFGSQGHLNPAVTIGFALFGFFPWSQVLPYLLGQFLGAFVGAVLVIIQYGAQFKNAKNTDDGNVKINTKVAIVSLKKLYKPLSIAGPVAKIPTTLPSSVFLAFLNCAPY